MNFALFNIKYNILVYIVLILKSGLYYDFMLLISFWFTFQCTGNSFHCNAIRFG
jgi:hypothetical protein